MREWERNLNALHVVVLAIVLLGAYGVQVFQHEEPCPLCMLQRMGMIGVAVAMLMNVKFGVRSFHYGLGIISAMIGGAVAARHVLLHVCTESNKLWTPIEGLNLYTWSFIVFASSTAAIALSMVIFDRKIERHEKPPALNVWSKFSFAFIFLISLANIITTLLQCGWALCPD